MKEQQSVIQATISENSKNSYNFLDFANLVRVHFNKITENNGYLFTTNVPKKDLWHSYLNGFGIIGMEEQKHHNCNCCKDFITKFGGLVVITEDYKVKSALWSFIEDGVLDRDSIYYNSAFNLNKLVSKSQINGVFLPMLDNLGVYESYEYFYTELINTWNHFSISIRNNINHSKLFYPNQPYEKYKKQAINHQDQAIRNNLYKVIALGLSEYTLETIKAGVSLLYSTEALYRQEEILPHAKWLLELKLALLDQPSSSCKRNVIWKALASASIGFCHVRSSMLVTLLDDIKAGLSYDVYSKKFKEKMSPLQYRRPQTKPNNGSINQAEKLFKELDLELSLKRRFATIDEIETIWKPKEVITKENKEKGIFDSLRETKEDLVNNSLQNIDGGTITFIKFKKKVLPIADKIEINILNYVYPFFVITTATDYDSKPILKWDLVEKRNPFSLYFYHNGANKTAFNLTTYGWYDITGISLRPNLWYKEIDEDEIKEILFVINNCKDLKNEALGLFPEILIEELHPVRSVIEAYSNSHKLDIIDEPSACGIGLGRNNDFSIPLVFKVTTGNSTTIYKIDKVS